MNINPAQYGSFVAVTPSDTTLISCRAIWIGTSAAQNLTINASQIGGSSVLFTAVTPGTLYPLALDQGRIMATGTTASNIVAFA